MKRKIFSILLITVIFFISFSATGTKKRDASSTPPGGLSPEQIPMFVTIGFDDNGFAGLAGTKVKGGMQWAIDFFSSKTNPAGKGNKDTYDGTPVSISFYALSVYIEKWDAGNPANAKQAWRNAYEKGFEIGCHTHNHHHGRNFTVAEWENEIKTNIEWLTKPFDPAEKFSPNPKKGVGMKKSEITGFRTPYLEYNDNTFKAIKKLGFVYDCSIEDGWAPEFDGTNFVWPYTLDNGSAGDEFAAKKNNFTPIGKHPGLWEMSCAPVIVPPDELCTKYGVEKGLRAKFNSVNPGFNINDGKVTGLDYNTWFDLHMNRSEMTATLKYTLDKRLEGNRAPFLFGGHSDIYASTYWVEAKNANYLERQQSIEDFINYALTIPSVRIVSINKILQWVRNPKPL